MVGDDAGDIPMGTSKSMCPEKERKMRLRERLIHPLECSPTYPRGDPELLVKCYSRPAAGKQKLDMSSLRPYPVLMTTVRYLMRLVSDWKTRDWSLVYGYVQDRLRALRQDIIIQRLPPAQIVSILRIATPFYYEASTTCQSQPCSSYDAGLHRAQMEETILILRDSLESLETVSNSDLQLVQADLIYHATDPLVLNRLCIYQDRFGNTEDWKSTRDLIWALRSGNFIRFARTFRGSPPLLQHAAITHIARFRSQCLRIIHTAYSNRNARIPIHVISRWLMIEPSSTKGFLEQSGLKINDDCVEFHGKPTDGTPKSDAGTSLISLDCLIPTLFHDIAGF